MLSDFELAVLKNNKIDPNDVEGVTTGYVVKMKDGSEHQLCEIYTRVMGYLRPKSEFNVGKRQEHDDRVLFKEPSNEDEDRTVA